MRLSAWHRRGTVEVVAAVQRNVVYTAGDARAEGEDLCLMSVADLRMWDTCRESQDAVCENV